MKIGEDIIRDEPDKWIALGNAWQHTFDAKPFDEGAASAYLETVGDICSYAKSPPPDFWTSSEVVWKPKSIAPGPDTFPYDAWTAAGEAGVFTLLGTGSGLRRAG